MAQLDPMANSIDENTEDEETPKKALPPLAESLRAGQQAIQQSVAAGPSDTPLDERDSNYYIGELEKLTKDPKYQAGLSTGSRRSLQDALSQAKELYQQKANRNDWLEVAQTLGQAVVQFGAAQAGMRGGANMSGLNIPSIDYGRRTDRAMQEYKQDVGLAGQEDALARQEALDNARRLGGEFKQKEDYLRSALNAKLHGESLESQEGRSDARLREQLAREAAREKLVSSRDEERAQREEQKQSNLERNVQLRDLSGQEKSLIDQIQAGRTLANALQQEDDLSGSQVKKLQEKYSGLAGKAGVDLTPAVQQYESTAPKGNGLLGTGLLAGVDREAKDPKTGENLSVRSLYDALGLTEKLKQLEALRQRKGELTGGGKSGPPAPAETPPTASKGEISPELLQQYMTKHSVDKTTAVQVLTNAGYTVRQ